VFNDAVVHFTHFGKMADNTGTSSLAMYAALVQCMAIIRVSSHDFVDLLIPVLLRAEAMLQESAMMGLLIKVKQHTTNRSTVDQPEIN
jgi:hypothetical protein